MQMDFLHMQKIFKKNFYLGIKYSQIKVLFKYLLAKDRKEKIQNSSLIQVLEMKHNI